MGKLVELKKRAWSNPLEYLLYLFVFLLPWQARWIFRDFLIEGDIFEYGRMSLYGFDILLGVMVIWAVIKSLREGRRQRGMVILMGLLVAVYGLLSVLWADEKLVSLYWGGRMLAGFLLFYMLRQINFSRLRLGIAAVMGGAIQGLLAIWQFLNQGVWGSKWLGMAAKSARDLGTSVVEFGLERWLRAYGSLPHPNILGAVLVLSFVGAIYLMGRIEDKYHKLFLLFSASFISLGIFFSFSRGAWIAFAAAYIFGLVYILKKRDSYISKFSKVLWIYLFVLLGVFSIATWPMVKTRLNIGAPARLEIKSNIERVEGYRQGMEVVRENMLLGVGAGNYAFEMQKKYPDLTGWEIGVVHNVYLLALAELGILGVVLILIFFGYLIFRLIKEKKWRHWGVLSVIFLLFLFDHFWWTQASGVYLVWLAAGLAAWGIKKS